MSSVSQAINGVSCDEVVLDASLTHQHHVSVDGSSSFTGGEMQFALPGSIPVTQGAPGGPPGQHVGATLTLTSSSGTTACDYVGNGPQNHGGTAYVFVACHDGDGNPVSTNPGDQVSASGFNLHVSDADVKEAVTAVHLVIDETRPCDAATRGEAIFNDRSLSSAPRTASYTMNLGGNGRACSDCHVEADAFQLSPATVQARFQAMQDTGTPDPLFNPIDANDFRTNGSSANDYTNLKAGLVRITFALPPQIKLIDPATNAPSSETTVDVWRSVPSIFNVAITGADNFGKVGDTNGAQIGPNPHGGYQLDGRVDTLENQALGAFQAHAQVTAAVPAGALSDIAAYEKTEFSSTAVGQLANAMLTNSLPFPDPDPVLTDEEQAGKVTFQRVCATCHGGPSWPSTSSPVIGQRYHRLRSQCPRPPVKDANDGFGHLALPGCTAQNMASVRTYQITAGTTVTRSTADDLGRAYFTGRSVDVGEFDVKDARGAVRTAPFFHNNSIDSIEQLVEFYRVFFIAVSRDFAPPNLPVAISTDGIHFDRFIPDAEVAGLTAYLKKL